jgi:hypothetical protein
MKNIKSFICGFIASALLFSLIPAYAAVQQSVQAKLSTVKCEIDGTTYNIESLNYNNKNRFPVRDIVEKMGGTVTMNNDTIVIKSSSDKPIADTQDNTNGYDSVNKISYCTYDGVKYIVAGEFDRYLYNINPGLSTTDAAGFNKDVEETGDGLCLKDSKTKEILLKNIPHIYIGSALYIPYDYFINTVIPTIKQ